MQQIMKILILIQGAVIAPSDKDSVTFSVNAANGDMFKLQGTKILAKIYIHFHKLSFSFLLVLLACDALACDALACVQT